MVRECLVDGCANPPRAKTRPGLCEAHRQRLRKRGTLESARLPFEERFDRWVDKSGDCWQWTGSRTVSRGVPWYGKTKNRGRTLLAHRVAWEFANGPIPDGLDVLHRCDNPICVNPDHLFLGTHTDNMQDRLAKGRKPNRMKSHCPQGHPYEGENLYVDPRGYRQCATCMAARQRIRRAKH